MILLSGLSWTHNRYGAISLERICRYDFICRSAVISLPDSFTLRTVALHVLSYFAWAFAVRTCVSVYLELWTFTQTEGLFWTATRNCVRIIIKRADATRDRAPRDRSALVCVGRRKGDSTTELPLAQVQRVQVSRERSQPPA